MGEVDTLTILPPVKAKPKRKHAIRCGHCSTEVFPTVRRYKSTAGEQGELLLATCFNCGSVLIAEFIPEEEKSGG